jgi:spore coat protein CotH
MPTRTLAGLTVVTVILLAGGPSAQEGSAVAPRPDRAQVAIVAGAARLYDTSKLHRVNVEIPPDDAAGLVRRTSTRVRATVTIDGIRLENVGVRQAGGSYHPYQPITNKPSLSLKFDEFINGQKLFGLDKLILKNELQDVSFLSEHLTYEIFRRAGLAAPLTAHAQVTLNGLDSGIYVMREPVDKEFLTRNFGSDFKNGNLYEVETTDFVHNPAYPPLGDEGVAGRTRADLVALASAVRSSTPDTFIATVGPLMDLDRLITFVAVETATVHWDGFSGNNNNTYIYAHPKDGRFILLPWGADQTLGLGRMGGFRRANGPRSATVQRLMSIPALAERLQAEIARVGREPVWDLPHLVARIERVARNLDAVESPSGRTAIDIAGFTSWRATVENAIK